MTADAAVARVMVLLMTRGTVHRCRAQLKPSAVTFCALDSCMRRVVEGKRPVL
jgi:hypothetical protein